MATITIADFQSIASSLPPRRVVIAGGDREEDLSLYALLHDTPYVGQCVLVGSEGGMKESAAELGIALDPADIVATQSQEETALAVAEMTRSGRAEVIQKGNISTPILNRQLVKLRTRDTISLVTVFEAGCIQDGRTLIMTDAGVTTVLDASRMTGLIHNAVEVAHGALRLPCPRVALLSGNEKIIPSLPSTVLADELSRARWEGMTVYGPLSFDLAVDPASVRVKLPKLEPGSALYEVAGRADILVNPGLDAANIFYKILMRMTESGLASMASVTVGLPIPYVISSRSDPGKTRLDSIALSCIYADDLRFEVTRDRKRV